MTTGLGGQLSKFQTRDAQLDQILAPEKAYEVPMFQRGYSWTKVEAEQLLDDLENALNKNEAEYFLGALVLRPQAGGRTVIIDGQQRLATLSILLAALRDRLIELGQSADAREVQRNIWPVVFAERKERILKLRDPDDSEFITSIQELHEPLVKGKAKGSSLMVKAKQVVTEKVGGDAAPLFREQCIKWVTFLRKAIRFVVIEVGDEVSAYTIFETLNDRGLDLAVEDLLRNYLCSKSATVEEAREQVLPHWEEMVKTLKDIQVRPSVFLRHYWMSHWEPVTKQSLYREYRGQIDKKDKTPKAFAESLLESAKKYVDLVKPEKGELGYKHLSNLFDLGATQCLPFLLAVQESPIYSRNFLEAAHLAESLTVLYSVLGDKNPNRLERKYSEWASAIRRGEKSLEEIKKDAAKLPDSNVIEQTFTKEPVREFSPAEARFLLKAFTEYELEGELEVSSPKKVHVDHIIAKNPTTGKPIDNSNRIGNLTLILGKWNQEMSNKPFVDKKDTYKGSNIPMTNSLANIESFDVEAMKQREKQFSEMALKIWQL